MTPASVITAWRVFIQACAASALWMSGRPTISMRGVPPLFQSTREDSRVVAELAGVFLHVDSLELKASHLAVDHAVNRPLGADRLIELADLVALRQVGVEVVLACKHRLIVHRTAERCTRSNRESNRLIVHHRERTWVAQADRADRGIGNGSVGDGAPAEHLRGRLGWQWTSRPMVGTSADTKTPRAPLG